jgi:hypothetical protein
MRRATLPCRLQFAGSLVEQAGEAAYGGIIGCADIRLVAAGFHDQIDRTVLQMQPPAVRQHCDLWPSRHARDPGAGCCVICRISALSFNDANGRTWSIWPPSAA